MVTRMHGAMRAAAAGPSPLGWRERFGPIPPAEALAFASTTWLLADLLDDLGEEHAQRDRCSDRIVELLRTVDPAQDGGGCAVDGPAPQRRSDPGPQRRVTGPTRRISACQASATICRSEERVGRQPSRSRARRF